MAGALGTIAKTVSEALGFSLYSVRPGLRDGANTRALVPFLCPVGVLPGHVLSVRYQTRAPLSLSPTLVNVAVSFGHGCILSLAFACVRV